MISRRSPPYIRSCNNICRCIRTYARRDVLGKTSTCVYIAHVRAGIIIRTRNTHGEGKSRSHLLAVPTAGVSCWTTHRSTDGRTDRRTYIGYCPVPGRSRPCIIGFVSTRFLSKDVPYAISITMSYPFLLLLYALYPLTIRYPVSETFYWSYWLRQQI